MKTSLTQEELQHIEFCNKIMREHLELVTSITEKTKEVFDAYIPTLQEYVRVMHTIQIEFGRVAVNIFKDGKELRAITGGHQEIYNYMQAAVKLDTALNDGLIQKILKLKGE